MATTNKRADKQKEKEKKEKILLAVLIVVLIIVGAIMLPGMLKKKGNIDQAAAQPAVTTAASTSGAGATPTGGTPASASAAAAAVSFPSTPGYQAAAGQLSKFGLFASNDPFGNVPGGGTQAGAASSSTTKTKTKTKAKAKTTATAEAYSAALISVNGTQEVVNLSASFPASSPMFGLDSITAKSITISVAGGSFSNGQSTAKIQKGHTLVLENTVDGTRYAIKLITPIKAGAELPVIATSPVITTLPDTGEPPSTSTTTTTASTTTTTASTTTT